MKSYLNLPTWGLFLICILGAFFSSLITNDLTLQLIATFGQIIYLIYPLIVGIYLHEFIPNKIELNNKLFIINWFIIIVFVIVTNIVLEGQEMKSNGLATIPFFYLIYAYLNVFAFPAKTLRSIELNREAVLRDYLADFFLILFLPIGIWFIQPRIMKILENENNLTA